LISRSTEPNNLDIDLFAKVNMLCAAALALTMLPCYVVSIFVFKQNSIGGFAWVLPLLVAGAVGVFMYRQHCLKFGVLTDSETFKMGRNMSTWTALAMLPVYGLAQKSVGDGVASLFMGLPIYAMVLMGGLFTVKTMLLVQNYDERGRDTQLSAEDLAKIVSDYRRQRGISDMPGQDVTGHNEPRVIQSPPMPMPMRESAAQNIPHPNDENEIKRKIHEVRARALKAARLAEKAANKNQQPLRTH
jgi:hypothetical protein